MDTNIIEFLKEYKDRNGLTNNEMGDLFFCTGFYFSRIMKGKFKPGRALAYRMKLLFEQEKHAYSCQAPQENAVNRHHDHEQPEVDVIPEPHKKILESITHNNPLGYFIHT